MNTKILTIVLSVLMLMMIIELIREEKLTFKYAFVWLLGAVLAIFFAVFEKYLFAIAYTLGFQVPSNFIFFTILAGFVFSSLLLTIFLCQQNSRNEKIVQKLGLVEHEVEELKKKLKS